MYYVLILLFAFLSTTEEKSLADVIANLDANEDNRRIARSLGLRKEHLNALRQTINWSVLSSLDYKIQNSDYRTNDDTITPVEHINIAINKFGKLSDSEVFTPVDIVDKVYDSFNDDFWQNISSAKVLDVASKSGSFAKGFVTRAMQSGATIEEAKNSFYSIPTSPAAYEFTRKMYEALDLNIDNIAQNFTSYDFLQLKHPTAITNLLEDKALSAITKEDLKSTDDKIESNESEGKQVKFSAIVGNPPYQKDTANSRTNPIYPQFMDSSYALSDKVCLITPGRFLFNAGQSSKQWNEKMLSDEHLEVVYFKQKSADIFPNTDIKGGVVITFRDADQILGPIGTFTPFEELNSVLHKVASSNSGNLSEIIFGNSSYRFTEKLYEDNPQLRGRVSSNEERSIGTKVFSTFPEVFLDAQPASGDFVCIYGREDNKRIFKWIKREYIATHPNLDKWKVFVPKSNGSGAIGEILSTPLIGEPLIGGTQTFISFGEFDTEAQAQSCMKYIKTKFARAMLGTLKITQHAPKGTWKNVPLQDFTSESDIDWSQSIANVDKQLYAKYGLDNNEINFIETRVRVME